MNIFGKILVWFIVLMVGTDLVLSARLLQIKNSWSKKVKYLQEENIAKAETLKATLKEEKEKKLEYSRLIVGWETYWDNKQGSQVANENKLSAGIGQADGIGINRPTLSAFLTKPDGSVWWAGPFRIEDPAAIGPNSSTLLPQWNPRDGEVANWLPGQQWRYRPQIPSSYFNHFITLYSSLEQTDNQLIEVARHLVEKDAAEKSNQRELNVYYAILQGDANTGQKGFVEELKEAENLRNRELQLLDRIRREVKKANDAIARYRSENKKLAKNLPQSSK